MGEQKRVDQQRAERHAKPLVPETTKDGGAAKAAKRPKADPVGRALRVAYEDALREDVPSDFLDLLGKLG